MLPRRRSWRSPSFSPATRSSAKKTPAACRRANLLEWLRQIAEATQQLPLVPEWTNSAFWVAVGQIIGIDILLAGDNAVVIALACRTLPPRQRLWGMILGAAAAILLRVTFTLLVSQAMSYPFLKLAGGLMLVWIAVKLLVPDVSGTDEERVKAADNLWRAVRIVAIADIIMSLDNVIAIAAAAETAAARLDPSHAQAIKSGLIVFGLAASIPLIVAGSAMVMALLTRFPLLVWVGAAILGWVAGDIMVRDDVVLWWLAPSQIVAFKPWAGALGALIVVVAGFILMRLRREGEEHQV
ncbi:MAG: TerC family protein [Xanthobacteraceae bacterium]|nr:MAG: TerC family protein [Xanthobacteraceae bacterium]